MFGNGSIAQSFEKVFDKLPQESILRRKALDRSAVGPQQHQRHWAWLAVTDGSAVNARDRNNFTSAAGQEHFFSARDFCNVEKVFMDLQSRFSSEIQHHTASYSLDNVGTVTGSQKLTFTHHVNVAG